MVASTAAVNTGPEREQWYVECFAEYNRPLFMYLYNRLNNYQLARDLVQELFLRFWRNVDAVNPQTVKHYLFMTATNLIHDQRRIMARGGVLALFDEVPDTATWISIGAETIRPESAIAHVLDVPEPVARAIAEMPAAYQETLSLFLAGLTQRQIAGRLKIPMGTVKSRMNWVLGHLRKVADKQEMTVWH